MKTSLALLALSSLLWLPAFAGAMDLGTNFWNLGWHKPDDCFKDFKNVSAEDPWNPEFLKEVAVYHSFRFMDWDNTNKSPREKWAERPHQNDPKQNPVAYEWMIDLCNRCNADMWVCIPHKSITRAQGDEPSDYALRLCLLVKTGVDMKEVDLKPLLDKLATLTPEQLIAAGGVKSGAPLKPNLKLYVEYSNETWNGMFEQAHYCCEEGAALKLDPKASLGNDGKQWTAGARYHAWAALRAFRAADLVFGPDSKRTVKVLAEHVASTFGAQQHVAVVNDPACNPWKTKATALAAAPYFGHKVDGDDPDAARKLREDILKAGANSAKLKKIAADAGLKLIAYEGGQHVLKKANVINRQPVMYDLYQEYLKEMSKYYAHFCHYAQVGKAGEKGCWGCIEFTGQDIKDAPKYRALADWAKAHPRQDDAKSPPPVSQP